MAYTIIQALFGKSYTRYCVDKMNQQVSVDWRASYANIDCLKQARENNKEKFSLESDFMLWIDRVITGMLQAMDNNTPYFTEYTYDQQSDVLKRTLTTKFNAHIIVIIDKHCFSATLNFIDYLKAMNCPVLLIGQTTGADSLYMDINQFLLLITTLSP